MEYSCVKCGGTSLIPFEAGELCDNCDTPGAQQACAVMAGEVLQAKRRGPCSPFTLAIDTREQLPYDFVGLKADARQGNKPLHVATRVMTLSAGDYSIDGFADQVAVERKSYADLAGTLTQGRDRFERELAKLNAMTVAWVVCEVGFNQMMAGPRTWSKVNPKTIWRSMFAYQVRFPKVHWFCHGDRAVCQSVTYRVLEKWWKIVVKGAEKNADRRYCTGG